MRSMKMTICLGLVAGLAVAAAPSASAQSLKDVLLEHDWDRVIGTWVDADTRGANLKVAYAWKFEEHLVEITTWTREERTVGLMGRNAQNGDIYHVGATSRGGSSLGKWEIVDGDAVLGLGFTGGDGQQGAMRIRHHLENDDTMVLTIEGPEPVTFKLIRVGMAEAPAAGAHTIEAQFKNAGIDPVHLDRWVRPVLSKRGGLKDEQIEPALMGILKTVFEVREEGEAFEMDAGLRSHLKDQIGLTDQQIGMVIGIARRLQGAGREERGRREGTFTEGATSVYVETLARNLDTNKSLIVEDGELKEGFLAMLAQYQECHSMLLTLFDGDKDGALNGKEGQAVRRFVFGLAGALLIDSSRDWKLDDKETDEAWATLADQSQRHNEAASRTAGRK